MTNEIIKAISEEHIQFFKRYLKYNYSLGQLVHVHLFRAWQAEEEIWVINDLIKKHGKDYQMISEVGSIVRVLQTYYAELEMGQDNMLETAYKLHETYIKRIHKFHAKKVAKSLKGKTYKFKAPTYTPEQAFQELVARGFTFQTSNTCKFSSNLYYLRHIAFGLRYPETWGTMTEAAHAQMRLGLPGYTGINQPNTK